MNSHELPTYEKKKLEKLMKSYYHHANSEKLSNKEKNEIYKRLGLKKTGRISLMQKMRPFLLGSGYVSIAGIVLLIIFHPTNITQRNLPITGGNRPLVIDNAPPSVVFASIGEIVRAQGAFTIEGSKDRSFGDRLIYPGDQIQLDGSSSLVFTLGRGTQARIVGPALLRIEKDASYINDIDEKSLYRIVLIEGELIHITQEARTHSEDTDQIIIETDEVEIKQDNITAVDVEVRKNKSSGTYIQNNGEGDLIVEHQEEPTQKVVLQKNQTATAQNERQNAQNNIENKANMDDSVHPLLMTGSTIPNQNTSGHDSKEKQNGEISDKELSLSIGENDTRERAFSKPSTSTISGNTLSGREMNGKNATYTQTQQQSGMTEIIKLAENIELQQEVSKKLHPTFVTKDCRDLLYYTLIGDYQGSQIVYKNISDRINSVHSMLSQTDSNNNQYTLEGIHSKIYSLLQDEKAYEQAGENNQKQLIQLAACISYAYSEIEFGIETISQNKTIDFADDLFIKNKIPISLIRIR